MVKLETVEDEHFGEDRPGFKEDITSEDDDADYSDTDESVTDNEDDDTFEETLYERFVALKDMIPPKHRLRIYDIYDTTYSWLSIGLRFGGKSLWVISTSVMMLGVPYALAVGEEQQMVEMEKEMKAQQLASSSLSSGGQSLLDEQRKK